jgi:LEA14-like dessication related protein
VVPLHYRVRIVRAAVYVNGKLVKVYRGRSLKQVAIPAAGGGRYTVRIVLRSSRGRTYASVRTYKGCKKTKPRRVK